MTPATVHRNVPLLVRLGKPLGDLVGRVQTIEEIEDEFLYDPETQRSRPLTPQAKGHVYTFISTGTGKRDCQERRYDPA